MDIEIVRSHHSSDIECADMIWCAIPVTRLPARQLHAIQDFNSLSPHADSAQHFTVLTITISQQAQSIICFALKAF